ncbi:MULTISPECIES: hypothetical protein [unclassified Arthrobacter]|uniref:hypothetical protein n=1 Tax=unclassified Arthrobacter TaxID=235627 RepID=UPI002DFB9EC2|nr:MULTISPECIES: hypothetical protein [unclassified Arthrobacter]MEC5192424.1 hypothetical protein [Arthrobacter sp. MP_M4]MEC5203908.1 hypothetical protein [Arthrobacter sp. MP_M7]
MAYTITVTVPLAWDEAVQRTRSPLPCCFVVRRGKGAAGMAIHRPLIRAVGTLGDSPAVRDVANDADARLRAALHTLSGAPAGV